MADGGNAVDAIVATAVTLTLVEPVSNGIGSDAFAIVWDGRQLHGLNASGRSPAAWTPEYFSGDAVPPCGLEFRDRAGRGVGVGGAARASSAGCRSPSCSSRRFTTAATVFWCRRRSPRSGRSRCRCSRSQPGFAEAFLRDGRAPMPGERFTLPRARRDAGKDRRDQRRGVLPRRTRGGNGGARASQRRRDARQRPCRASRRLGRHDRRRLSRLHRARDPAQRPGHRRADRARHSRELRHGRASGRFGRQRAPADRGGEARLRRRAGLRRRHRLHGRCARSSCSTRST